jgi:hypothetical protein
VGIGVAEPFSAGESGNPGVNPHLHRDPLAGKRKRDTEQKEETPNAKQDRALVIGTCGPACQYHLTRHILAV